jgi:uncharacterized protein YbjT (DUF2867 family)
VIFMAVSCAQRGWRASRRRAAKRTVGGWPTVPYDRETEDRVDITLGMGYCHLPGDGRRVRVNTRGTDGVNAMTTVCVFGGTGFLGRRIVRRLAARDAAVRVAVRHPDPARSVLSAAGLDRVTVVAADVRDEAAVAAAVAGTDAVVNAVSAYVEKGGVTFAAVHERGAETIAREARAAGTVRLVLVSGIGADPTSASPYIRARGRGEELVRQAFPGATIVRPSAMFGPGDALFGTLADIARLSPVLPLIGSGRTRLQPVYVEDVAEAIARIVFDPGTAGRIYEAAGPGVYTLR